MAVFSQEGERTQCGVVRNYVTPEMLYVSDSSGERFDERSQALASHENPLEGVLAETARERSRKKKSRPEAYEPAA